MLPNRRLKHPLHPPATRLQEKAIFLWHFFSQAGEQYGVGVVEKGNTQIVAEMIANETDADLFHIERKEAYPTTYNDLLSEAQDELKNSVRPELSATVDKWDDYDVVFIGYPIWWGDMPMPVYTFLESFDWTGKNSHSF
jgi:flavodoxin